MLAPSYLFLLATDTHTGELKICQVSVRIRLGAQPVGVLVGAERRSGAVELEQFLIRLPSEKFDVGFCPGLELVFKLA